VHKFEHARAVGEIAVECGGEAQGFGDGADGTRLGVADFDQSSAIRS
jgi:hypothetical protein